MSTQEKRLADLYFANLEFLEEGMPDFVRKHRAEAIESFRLAGLPTRKNEKYRYTDVAARYDHDLEYYFTPFGVDCPDIETLPFDTYEIRVKNGFAEDHRELTHHSDGVVYGSLRTALDCYPELTEQYFNRLADGSDGLVALNTALFQDGIFIYVPDHVKVEKPFEVMNCLSAEESVSVFNRCLFVFGKNSEAKVIFRSVTACDDTYIVNRVSEVYTGENASVEIADKQEQCDGCVFLSNTFVDQQRSSRFQKSVVILTGGFVRNNTEIFLNGTGVESHLYGFFASGQGQHIDNYSNIEHRVPDCQSFELFKGIASANGVGVFNGRILVAEDAQRTRAFQENHNLLLSDHASVYTKPQLEIHADDVKCSHGATIGQLDEQAVFYMRQRGIGENDARKLQMFGFVNDIIEKIGIPEFRDYLVEKAGDKISKL